MIRRFVRIVLWALLALLVLVAGFAAWNWDSIQRIFLGGVKVYETTPPAVPDNLKHPAILVFSKTNGFRHEEAIPAAHALFAALAKDNGWSVFATENGAAFTPAILARFDAVVFNNVSGDVFIADQRAALRQFIENGGGFVGIHGSGGDMSYAWQWYVESLIGGQFIGHPMDPQFQLATVRIETQAHSATAGLPATWQRTDEWYSFAKSPRKPGVTVLATLDEATYSPKGFFGTDLKMGKDHPIAWAHCQGKGRTFYSALGHTPASYSEANYRAMLLGATRWALRQAGDGCDGTALAAGQQN
jgi:type 1 glutamine amidotransferase